MQSFPLSGVTLYNACFIPAEAKGCSLFKVQAGIMLEAGASTALRNASGSSGPRDEESNGAYSREAEEQGRQGHCMGRHIPAQLLEGQEGSRLGTSEPPRARERAGTPGHAAWSRHQPWQHQPPCGSAPQTLVFHPKAMPWESSLDLQFQFVAGFRTRPLDQRELCASQSAGPSGHRGWLSTAWLSHHFTCLSRGAAATLRAQEIIQLQ